MGAAGAEGFLDADLAGSLLHADEHDVHEADAGDAEGEGADKEQEGFERERDEAELRELLHDVGDEDGVAVGRPKGVGGTEQDSRGLLDGGVVAAVAEPESVDVAGVLDVGVGGEGEIDDAVEVVVALLHLGLEDADDLKADAADADGLPEGVGAGEELLLGFGADDGDVGAPLEIVGGEPAALRYVHVHDADEFGPDTVGLPGVAVEVVLDGDVLVHDGGGGGHALEALLDALDIVDVEADFNAGPGTAGLLGGSAGKDADHVRPELGKDGLKGATEACTVGEQKDDGGDAPGHAEHGDSGATKVMAHGFDGLAEDVAEHA